MNDNPITATLRNKTTADQIKLAQTLLDAGRKGRLPLTDLERKNLVDFIATLQKRRVVDEALMYEVNKLVRHFEQHLLARASGTQVTIDRDKI